MIERQHTRAAYRREVVLRCEHRGIHYKTKTRDVGLGGLCVSGRHCMEPSNVLQLSLWVRDRYLQIPSFVAWTSCDCIGLSFLPLNSFNETALSMLVSPCWDGKDMLEGVIRLGQLMPMHDLHDCMLTTTLLQTELRKICRTRRM